jgi:hypothetical protein
MTPNNDTKKRIKNAEKREKFFSFIKTTLFMEENELIKNRIEVIIIKKIV